VYWKKDVGGGGKWPGVGEKGAGLWGKKFDGNPLAKTSLRRKLIAVECQYRALKPLSGKSLDLTRK